MKFEFKGSLTLAITVCILLFQLNKLFCQEVIYTSQEYTIRHDSIIYEKQSVKDSILNKKKMHEFWKSMFNMDFEFKNYFYIDKPTLKNKPIRILNKKECKVDDTITFILKLIYSKEDEPYNGGFYISKEVKLVNVKYCELYNGYNEAGDFKKPNGNCNSLFVTKYKEVWIYKLVPKAAGEVVIYPFELKSKYQNVTIRSKKTKIKIVASQ